MKASKSTALMCAAALGCVPYVTHAQERGTERDAGASREVAADSADASANDIIVTAQFRTTNLQDTPLAIAAVSGDALAARGLTDVKSLATVAPSLSMTQPGGAAPKTVFTSIRGVGVGDYDPAFDPAVGFYIDDVYYSALIGSTFDLLDLERVEVLRGPQGTLFGKNTIGGAVRLISKKPNGQFSGYVEGSYGSYERKDIRAGLNIPLAGDALAVRLSGVHKETKGYIKRYDFVCRNPSLSGTLPSSGGTASDCTVGREGGENVDAVRLALRAQPTSGLDINLVGDYSIDHSEPGAQILVQTGTTAVLNGPRGVNPRQYIPRFGISYDDRFICGDFCTYSNFTNPLTGDVFAPRVRIESYGFSGTVDYDVSDSLKFKSMTGYRSVNERFVIDRDGSPLATSNQNNLIAYKQFSQELQLIGKALDDNLDWVVGAYYFNGKPKFRAYVDLVGSGLLSLANHDFTIKDYSGFAHMTYHVTDRFNVTGGLRYTRETKDAHVRQSYACYVVGGSGNRIPGCLPSVDQITQLKYQRWDPKISVDYHVFDDVMIYAQFATGFRGGGLNDRPLSPVQVFSVDPEKLKSYEVGVKSQFWDRRITFNVTAFQSDYTDIQQLVSGTDSLGIPFVSYLNTGDARIRGLELESALRLDAFELTLNANYLDAKIVTPRAANSTVNPNSLPAKGTRLAYAPKFKFNAGMQYAIGLGDRGTLTPRVDLSYQSAIAYDTTNSPLAREPGYTVTNARLTWQSPNRDFSLALGVTNIFDNYYYSHRTNGITQNAGQLMATPARPREWSLTARTTF